MKGFSIIVCCYNSAMVIEQTLQHLGRLQIPSGYHAEVVIVNNACTDNTIEIVHETWHRLNAPFDMIVVDEHQPGLSYARNKGIATSRCDYILFCDDDNRLNGDYLSTAAAVLCEHTEIGALGGLGIPDYEVVPDYWPEDFYIYGSGPQAMASGKVTYVHGAGVIVRRDVFRKVEMADFRFLLTDRKGDQLSSGGDYELCYAIGLAGYVVWYEQQLEFKHFITADRLAQSYCWKFIRESAPAIDVLEVYGYCLRHHNPLHMGFYFRQIKLLIYHGYLVYRSAWTKFKYRRDKQIDFLENFHIRFHKMRIRCIVLSFPKYKIWGKEIMALKGRIGQIMP